MRFLRYDIPIAEVIIGDSKGLHTKAIFFDNDGNNPLTFTEPTLDILSCESYRYGKV